MLLKKIKAKLWINNKLKYQIRDEDKDTIFEHTETKIWLWANYIIIVLIILSVIIVLLNTIPWFNNKYLFEIFIVDLIISIIFLIEYIYRWRHSWHKKVFPFRIMNILHLLSFLPFFILIYLYWIWAYSIFALFRIFRIFRIFELIQRIPILAKIWKWINKHKTEYITAICVILIILIIWSTLVFLVENKWWNNHIFTSIPNTFWWAVVTMSNTWYWDMIPVTIIWKTIAWLLMILWPILITILSSITVIIFIQSTKIIPLNWQIIKCNSCSIENDIDAIFCKKCWKNI